MRLIAVLISFLQVKYSNNCTGWRSMIGNRQLTSCCINRFQCMMQSMRVINDLSKRYPQ